MKRARRANCRQSPRRGPVGSLICELLMRPLYRSSMAVELVPIPAQLLGTVHRDVGVAQQRFAVARVRRVDRYADARADAEHASLDAELRLERPQRLLGHELAV